MEKVLWEGDDVDGQDASASVDENENVIIGVLDKLDPEGPIVLSELAAVQMARRILKHFGVKEIR